MLDQLVESKSNSKENARKSEFFIGIGILAVITLVSSWTYSLFGKDYNMGGGDLELTSLVAPPPPDEEPPPKPEKEPEKPKQPDVDVRKELIQNIMSSPVKPPDEIETANTKFVAMRENVKTVVGNENVTNPGAVAQRGDGAVSGQPTLGGGGNDSDPVDEVKEKPPEIKTTPKPAPKTVSGGVLNGKATSLPKPAYPAAAKAVRAAGAVSVQVLISESGSVISANAVSGHPLLRAAAEGAARGARFSPTLLSGQPVKVSGVITYNFVP